MSKKDDKIVNFVDALSFDLAQHVLEDQDALEKELNDMGSERVDAMVRRLQAAGTRIVARERRKRLQDFRPGHEGLQSAGRYDDLSHPELIRLALARTTEGAAMNLRELESMPTEDLQSYLEDLDAAGEKEDG